MAKIKIDLDLNAVDGLNKRLSRSGSDLFVGHKDIAPSLFIRLLPCHPNIASTNVMVEKGYWINRKRYVSPKTFGKPCPIAEELEEAKALVAGDPHKWGDLGKLIESKNFSEKEVLMFAVAVIEVKDERKFDFSGIRDNMIKVLQVGPQLGKAITGLIANPPIPNRLDLFAQDGYIIKCTKTGSGMNTEYDAQMIVAKYEIPDELYDLDKIPDIYEITRKKLMPDDYLRGVIRNYLYGEPMPVEPDKESAKANEDSKPAASAKLTKPKQPTQPQTTQRKRRSLMDDLRS